MNFNQFAPAPMEDSVYIPFKENSNNLLNVYKEKYDSLLNDITDLKSSVCSGGTIDIEALDTTQF